MLVQKEKVEKNIQKLAENFMSVKNEKNFRELFERLRPGLLNHCFVILKDRELAEDAFINAMAKIWSKIDQYDDERGNFSTWCYNIARNESLLVIKSRSKYVSQNEKEMDFHSNKTESASSEFYFLEQSSEYAFLDEENSIDTVYDSVVDEIRTLPELYRDIMVDREINGMKYKDIAIKYGIKKRSIATRIRRARARIKKKMGKQ
jgi:RNA polymerase sigma-70 factor (ECF subfamily)